MVNRIGFYTCDVNELELPVDKPERKPLTRQEKKAKKVRARLQRNEYKTKCLNGQISTSAKFETDDDIVKMRRGYPQEFFYVFKTGVDHYISGDWVQAKLELDKVEVSIEKLKIIDG